MMHYTATANGQPACAGYRRYVPDTEPGLRDRASVTCPDCRELMEAAPYTPADSNERQNAYWRRVGGHD